MIKIEEKRNVFFGRTQMSGRKTYDYIRAKRASSKFKEPAFINLPATGDMQLQDVEEFIKAIRLAAMIASGELEID